MNRLSEGQKKVIDFLAEAASYSMSGPVEIIETHISMIFLVGDRAFKLKRAVDLPYAHFETPELRFETCRKELALNSPTAPGLYLKVRRITWTETGGLEFDGNGALADSAVEMVRFEQAALFDRLAIAGDLTAPLMSDLARRIAEVHSRAPIVHSGSGSANLAAVLAINRAGFATSRVFPEAEVSAFDAAFHRRLAGHAVTLDTREAAGLVRRCHGDLHLRNICMFDGRPTLFDCIDFNDQIATIDVLYDLAFLLMDLWHRDLHGLANLVANRYFDAADTDAGYELLPFLMALRAAVRAHVTATFAEDAGPDRERQAGIARGYFDLALDLLHAEPAGVLAIGGLSGSGKSTVAEALAPDFGPPPGARIVESDRTRKAMFGVPAETPLPQGAYRREVSDEVYRRLSARSRGLADAGASVVVDAVFDRADRRAGLESAVAGHPFTGVWLTADPETLRERVVSGARGASDATLPVLESQIGREIGPLTWRPVRNESALTDVVAAVLGAHGTS